MKSTSRKLSRRVVVTEEGGREGKSRERERRERGESTEAAMVSVDPLVLKRTTRCVQCWLGIRAVTTRDSGEQQRMPPTSPGWMLRVVTMAERIYRLALGKGSEGGTRTHLVCEEVCVEQVR